MHRHTLSSLYLLLPTLLPLTVVAQGHRTRQAIHKPVPETALRPNVILLVTDDVGWGDLSCYGATRVTTPAIDSLAARGVRLTNMHACASTSTPSRYGLLTGAYPFRKRGTDVAAGNAGMIISPGRTTLADLMHRGGYATAAIGKWHLGLGRETGGQDWNGRIDLTPADLGFDYHYIMAATADRVPCVWIEQGRVADYDPSAPISVSYDRPFAGEPTGRSNPEQLILKPSHGHDQSIVNGISRIGYMKGGGRALWHDEDLADSIVTHTVRFIDSHRRQPFFIYLCTNDVHVPRWPAARFRGQSAMGLRGDAILQLDATVRAITDALRTRGLDQNTLLVITSDNGPVLDDGYQDDAVRLAGGHRPAGPWRGMKYSAFEGGSAVPFIAYWPKGIRHALVSDALASLIDAPATLASLAGVSPAPSEASDSRNSLAVWLGLSTKPRPFAVSMAANRCLTLRTPHYKYISPSDGGPMITWGPKIETGYKPQPQLYDLSDTHLEAIDVAADRPNIVQRMQRLLGKIRGGD